MEQDEIGPIYVLGAVIFVTIIACTYYLQDKFYTNIHHHYCDGSTIIYEKARVK